MESKLKKIIPLSLIILLTIILISSLLIPGKKSKTISVYVPKGTGTLLLYKNLKDKKIVNSKILFIITMKINRVLNGTIKPGYYNLQESMSYYKIGKMVSSGKLATLTIPEGLTQKEIAALLQKKLNVKDSKYLNRLKNKIPNYEGQLFPATYKLRSNSPEKFINRMLSTFKIRVKKLNPSKEDIILASMIQSEGARVSEFKRISGVFQNRLDIGMRLESDPTLQYIVGKIRLTKKVLLNTSGYNSYLHFGLPPGPICNPGIEAIKAAQNPEKHDLYYFVAKKDGTHYFSKFKWEHFRAVGFYQLGYKNGFIPQR